MSTTIQIKRSSTASAVPLSGDLAVGELAVNLADKRLFAKQADGTIIELSTNPTDLDAATLRIDGVEITASATELNSLDGLTATTAELNILDGVTATATELNKLDGFTGSTAELNLLDGVTATTAELNFVDGVTSNVQTQLNAKQPLDAQLTDIAGLTPTDGSFIVGNGVNFVAESGNTAIASLGVTATAAELNILDGVTATTAELNITDGLTATTTELNTLDGITATTTELNYTDGVTSSIQTQLNGKATSAQGALADTAVQTNDNVTFGTGDFTGDVDVTGTISTSGGTTVAYRFDANRGTDSSAQGLRFGYSGLDAYRTNVALSSTQTPINFTQTGSDGTKTVGKFETNGNFHLFEDTGTTAKMVWDASAESLSVSGKGNFGGDSAFAGDGTIHAIGSLGIGSATNLNPAINRWSLRARAGGVDGAFDIYDARYSQSRLTINSSGNVGIGTASPNTSYKLDVRGRSGFGMANTTLPTLGSDTANFRIGNLSGSTINYGTMFGTLGTGGGYIQQQRFDGNATAYDLLLQPNGGSVGIGTASPIRPLHVDGAGKGDIYTGVFTNSTTDTDHYNVVNFTQGAVGSANGYLGTGGSAASNPSFRNNFVVGTQSSNPLVFNTNDTERARIDSSGNLLVGKTSADAGATAGFEFRRDLNNLTYLARAGNAITLNRLSSDGDIALFRKDGTTVGSIGVSSSRLYVGTDDTGLFTNSNSDAIQPFNTTTGTVRDGLIGLGTSGARFKDLYLSGGVYLGGTGAVNKLDDYEEGTFTPTYIPSTGGESVTYSTQGGYYTKVGNIVHFNLFIKFSTVTAMGSGNIRIYGLPFNADLLTNERGRASVSVSGVSFSSVKTPHAYFQNGNAYLGVVLEEGGQSEVLGSVSNFIFSANDTIAVYGSYKVNV